MGVERKRRSGEKLDFIFLCREKGARFSVSFLRDMVIVFVQRWWA